MARIKVTITIPDYEYENWNDFQDGIEEIMANLKAEISGQGNIYYQGEPSSIIFHRIGSGNLLKQ